MIPVLKHGKGFRGLLAYAIQKEGAYMIGPIQGSVDDLSAQFGVIRGKNQRVQKPVLHLSLSLHPSEHLHDREWVGLVRKMMAGLGYDNNMYVIVRHTDEPQDHVHVIASRIRSDTYKTVPTYQEKWRASAVAAQLEQEYGLQRAALDRYGRKGAPKHAREKQGEAAMRKERGVSSTRTMIRERIDAAAAGRPTMTEFVDRLALFGVGFKANIGGDHVSGVTFELNGSVVKGSKLGRSWQTLLGCVDYQAERDLAALRKAKARLNRAPEALSPEAAKALDAHRIESALQRLAHGGNRELPTGMQSHFASSSKRILGRKSTGELTEILHMLGRVAHRIESNPFSSLSQKEEEEREHGQTKRQRR